MQLEKTTNTLSTLAPLNFVYDRISQYIYFNNLQQWNARLKHIERLFDGVTTFGHIKNPIHQSVPTLYDNIIIRDWFTDYATLYLRDYALNRRKMVNDNKSYYNLLLLIANYLLKSIEAKSVTISKNAEKEYNRRMTFPESSLKDEDIDGEFCFDVIYKNLNEFDYWLRDLYYIPKKENKRDTISWNKITRIRTPYNQLTVEQKAIHDNMTAIQDLVKANRDNLDKSTIQKLNKIVGDLKYSLGTLAQSPNIERSSNEMIYRFNADDHQEDLANAILDNLDYTNPMHIKALIENYHDLHIKYYNQPDSPVYTILTEFREHLHNVKLSPNHRLILMAFMDKSSNKKKVADLLESFMDISTEKMMRTIKTSISKKITKYFEKHVGK